jgi:hypothetical protein
MGLAAAGAGAAQKQASRPRLKAISKDRSFIVVFSILGSIHFKAAAPGHSRHGDAKSDVTGETGVQRRWNHGVLSVAVNAAKGVAALNRWINSEGLKAQKMIALGQSFTRIPSPERATEAGNSGERLSLLNSGEHLPNLFINLRRGQFLRQLHRVQRNAKLLTGPLG